MKEITIQTQMLSENDAYAIIANLINKNFKNSCHPLIQKHISGANKINGTGKVQINVNDLSKTETVQLILELKKLYQNKLISIEAKFFDKKQDKLLTFVKVPCLSKKIAEDYINTYKLNIQPEVLI